MAVLTADLLIQRRGNWAVRSLPAAVDILYKGAQVHINTAGNVDPVANVVGSVALGIMGTQADNSGGSAGDIDAEVLVPAGLGEALLTGSGFAQSDVNRVVYLSDDQTITTADPGNTIIYGRITEFVSSTQVWVAVKNLSDTG